MIIIKKNVLSLANTESIILENMHISETFKLINSKEDIIYLIELILIHINKWQKKLFHVHLQQI